MCVVPMDALREDNVEERLTENFSVVRFTLKHFVYVSDKKIHISPSVCLSVPVVHWAKQVISCSFPCLNVHEGLCIECLWLNVGVETVGHGAEPPALSSKLIWDS